MVPPLVALKNYIEHLDVKEKFPSLDGHELRPITGSVSILLQGKKLTFTDSLQHVPGHYILDVGRLIGSDCFFQTFR